MKTHWVRLASSRSNLSLSSPDGLRLWLLTYKTHIPPQIYFRCSSSYMVSVYTGQFYCLFLCCHTQWRLVSSLSEEQEETGPLGQSVPQLVRNSASAQREQHAAL